MIEGYSPRTAHLDDEGPREPVLSPANEDEILFELRFGMTYERGKNSSGDAHEAAITSLAQRVYSHLTQSNFVIMKKPPLLQPHIMRGYKGYLTN
jgi:hypothetical protein